MRWVVVILFSCSSQAQVSTPSSGDLMRAAVEKQRAAIAAQREAVRKQAALAGVWLAPFSAEPQGAADAAPGAPAPQCEPLADEIMAPIIDRTAKARGLQPKLLRAVIEQESGFHACAVSPKGAKGLMQLMPATADQFGVEDPFDPRQNIEAGAEYLKLLLDKYKGDLAHALGAYNSGPGTVDQAGGVPEIQETKDYVGAILRAIAK